MKPDKPKKQAFDTTGLPTSGTDWQFGLSVQYPDEVTVTLFESVKFFVENCAGRAAFSCFVDEMIELRAEIARRKGGKG